MASRALAGFELPNGPGLGLTDTGQPWLQHRGTAEIKSGRAFFPASNPGAFATVDVGAGGGDCYVTMNFVPNDGGGQSLYFRVVDANRYWRLYKRRYTYSYTYQSGMSEPVYGWVGTGQYYYYPADWTRTGTYPLNSSHPEYTSYRTVYYDYDSRVNAYLGREDYNNGTMITYQRRTVAEIQSNEIVTPAQPIYSTAYATAFEVVLDKYDNGSLVSRSAVGTQNSLSSLAVNLDGSNITCYADGVEVFTKNDPTHATARRHGIGLSEYSDPNSSGIDAFSAYPFVESGYVPVIML